MNILEKCISLGNEDDAYLNHWRLTSYCYRWDKLCVLVWMYFPPANFYIKYTEMRASPWCSNTPSWLNEARLEERGKVSCVFLDVTLKQYLGSFLHPAVNATGSDAITIAITAMMLPRIHENHGQHLKWTMVGMHSTMMFRHLDKSTS